MTPTVTLRRLAAWLAERGYGYDIDPSEGVVRSTVAGLDYVLMVVDRRILAVRAHHRLAAPLPGAATLSRVRAVAQEVSSGRLIPALYTEVDDAGLSLCAEVLTNIGAGLDDAQLAGTMDFVLDGVDEALREVLSLLDDGADSRLDADAEPEAERVEPERSRAEADDEAAAIAGADTPAQAADRMVDATLEMAAIIDGPGIDGPEVEARAQLPAQVHAEPAAGVKSDEGRGENVAAPGDADGGTEVETTNTPTPLLVS
ncbi:hypothetical protein [Actinomyces sp. ZJ308]|uniref:hypothetical protein n=1 Tax=Actinomyces sp. ZJ308 TaxID=2708342 RepID=UPI001FBAABFA|nr:hypothetical protein [Actinomyces sp. ZJ308]